MENKLDEVLSEIPVVRKALGWIPLVTPTSQIVGTQAMLNVKFGRWKNLAQATADLALGKYGQAPGPVDPEVISLAAKHSGQSPVTGRPADGLAPRMAGLRAELIAKGLPSDDDTAVLYAMFPRETEALLKPKPKSLAAPVNAPQAIVSPPKTTTSAGPTAPSLAAASRLRISVGEKSFEVTVEDLG